LNQKIFYNKIINEQELLQNNPQEPNLISGRSLSFMSRCRLGVSSKLYPRNRRTCWYWLNAFFCSCIYWLFRLSRRGCSLDHYYFLSTERESKSGAKLS